MGSVASSRVEHSLHIIRVTPGSPAHKAGLLPVFHYVVAVNKKSIESEEDIARISDSWEKKALELQIFDCRTETAFSVHMAREGGEKIGLGAKLHAGEMRPVTFRVLDLDFNSPGLKARLRKGEDYIIGYDGGVFSSLEEFQTILYRHRGAPLGLLVYNIGTALIRRVEVTPNTEGGIGCDLGTGVFNEIPYMNMEMDIDPGMRAKPEEGGPEIMPENAAQENVSSGKSVEESLAEDIKGKCTAGPQTSLPEVTEESRCTDQAANHSALALFDQPLSLESSAEATSRLLASDFLMPDRDCGMEERKPIEGHEIEPELFEGAGEASCSRDSAEQCWAHLPADEAPQAASEEELPPIDPAIFDLAEGDHALDPGEYVRGGATPAEDLPAEECPLSTDDVSQLFKDDYVPFLLDSHPEEFSAAAPCNPLFCAEKTSESFQTDFSSGEVDSATLGKRAE